MKQTTIIIIVIVVFLIIGTVVFLFANSNKNAIPTVSVNESRSGIGNLLSNLNAGNLGSLVTLFKS